MSEAEIEAHARAMVETFLELAADGEVDAET